MKISPAAVAVFAVVNLVSGFVSAAALVVVCVLGCGAYTLVHLVDAPTEHPRHR